MQDAIAVQSLKSDIALLQIDSDNLSESLNDMFKFQMLFFIWHFL